MTSRDKDASPRQRELLDVLADFSEPQPAAVLARIMRYKHGVRSPSVVYDLLGALERRGHVRRVEGGWKTVQQ